MLTFIITLCDMRAEGQSGGGFAFTNRTFPIPDRHNYEDRS